MPGHLSLSLSLSLALFSLSLSFVDELYIARFAPGALSTPPIAYLGNHGVKTSRNIGEIDVDLDDRAKYPR